MGGKLLPQRISFITLGARDVAVLRRFYAALGWAENAGSSDEFASFTAGSVRLALYPLEALGAEAAPGEASPEGTAWNGTTLAVNLANRAAVDQAWQAAVHAGAEGVVSPVDREWGGYSGYVADPEGNRWEIAYAPGYDPLPAQATLDVPAPEREEARACIDRIAMTFGDAQPPTLETLAERRRLRSEGGGPFPAPWRHPSPRVEGALRWLDVDDPRGTYVFIHGGGWSTGGADHQDETLWSLACASGLSVASVEYRLAPEHPFPAAIDDCVAAVASVEGPIVLGGDSSGAHLALSTLLLLQDRSRVAAVNLLYGVYDLSLTPSIRNWNGPNLFLDRETLERFVEWFTPAISPEERRSPEVSPLYADLRGLPPVLLSVGALDPLLDDSLFLAARLGAAGAEVQLDVYPDAGHGFTNLGIGLSTRAEQRQVDFIRRHL